MPREHAALEALFGCTLAREAPLLDRGGELWVRRLENNLYKLLVARDGVPVPTHDEPLASPVVGREAVYDMLSGAMIEREVHDGGTAVVRRIHLNGAIHTSREAWSEGVLHVASAWHVPPFGVVERAFRRDGDRWTIRVHDRQVIEYGGGWQGKHEVTCRDEADAIAHAEQRIASYVADGYRLATIDLVEPTRSHPVPPLVATADPYEAVDNAVTRIRDLARALPRGHFIVEDIDASRVAELGYGDWFCSMHDGKFARWATLADVRRTGSSMDYFFARYGSLTWIVDSAISAGLPMFHCGNVSGGGWCCLELTTEEYDTSGIAGCHPGRGYERARVFHGGWGRWGFIADTRVASATGEHPIYSFCDDGPMDEDELLPEVPMDAAQITPFGHWLEAHVHALVSELSHRLPFVNA